MNNETKRRAGLFLDRDGTLIEDRGHIHDQSQVTFIPGTVEALKRLQQEFILFVVTNQPGIAEGALSSREVEGVNNHIVTYLAESGVHIQDVYVCPHRREDGCLCIKPKPYFLHLAANQWNIDLNLSIVVGDHPSDMDLAKNAGCGAIYVLTGHGSKHLKELQHDLLVVSRLKEAEDWIFALARYENKVQNLKEELRRAGAVIRQGRLVAFPTETVYGLGANAYDAKAVARVFKIKRRPKIDPLIVHVVDLAQAESIVEEFTVAAKKLAETFWPGPLTLVIPKNNKIPEIVTAGLPNVAIRIPDNQLALSLIQQAGVPIAAPSANPFGYISPTRADHVIEQLGENIDMVLDGGACRVGIESTIVSFTNGQPIILRHGGIPAEEIERVAGPVANVVQRKNRPVTPGQFPRHYSPKTPLILMNRNGEVPSGCRAGLLSFGAIATDETYVTVEVLSQSCDLHEAATNLYGALRRLDAKKLDVIVANLVPDEGIGVAINDRLMKASNKSIDNRK